MIYVALEGIDGSGKSTQAKELSSKLKNCKILTQPSRGHIGTLIRQYLKGEYEIINETAFELLHAADRAENFGLDFRYKYDKYDYVISDRSIYSQYAYSNIDEESIRTINFYNEYPDDWFYIDIEPEIAFTRIKSDDSDIYENIEKLENVRERYFQLVDDYDGYVIDGNQEPEKVTKDILEWFK